MRWFYRDPFARLTLGHRRVRVSTEFPSCAWCGMTPRTGWLYRYTAIADDSRGVVTRREASGAFCDVECARAYHPTLPRPTDRRYRA